VSIARWNLKEAAGKTLARRTETAWGEQAGWGGKYLQSPIPVRKAWTYMRRA